MSNYKKKFLILIPVLFFVLTLMSPLFIQAKDRELEVDYPGIDNWQPETVEQAVLPEYIKYIFNLAIIIGGLIVFGTLVYGGIRWMTSAGNPTALSDAQNQILSGFLGIVILLLSWLILSTIDPELTFFDLGRLSKIRTVSIPGVYLSPETIFPSNQDIESGAKKAYYIVSSISNLKIILSEGETIKSLKFLNQLGFTVGVPKGEACPEGTTLSPLIECGLDSWAGETAECCTPNQEPEPPSSYYGVVLHEKLDMQGNCNFYRSVGLNSYNEPNVNPNPESITVFQETENSFGEVVVYKDPNHLGEEMTLTSTPAVTSPSTKWKQLPSDFVNEIQSVEIKGDFLLVLRGDNRCATIDKSSSNLKEYNIDKCDCTWWSLFLSCSPCVTEYALFPLKGTGK